MQFIWCREEICTLVEAEKQYKGLSKGWFAFVEFRSLLFCQSPNRSPPSAKSRVVGAFRSWSRPVAAPTIQRRFV